MANSQVIKAICRRIEDRYGSGKAAAMAAGVSAGIWSTYCSDEPQHATTTIPFHRVFFVANASERAALAALLVGDDTTPPADIMTEASEATEAAAVLQRQVREAGPNITPIKARQLRQTGAAALVEVMDAIRAIDAA